MMVPEWTETCWSGFYKFNWFLTISRFYTIKCISCTIQQLHELLLLVCCCSALKTQKMISNKFTHSVGNKDIYNAMQFTLHQPVESGVRKCRGAGCPWRLVSPPLPQNQGTFFMSPFYPLEFWGGCQISGKSVHPCITWILGQFVHLQGTVSSSRQPDFLTDRFSSRLRPTASSKDKARVGNEFAFHLHTGLYG